MTVCSAWKPAGYGCGDSGANAPRSIGKNSTVHTQTTKLCRSSLRVICVNFLNDFLFTDHQGSTSLTTDGNGSKISELRYKPWGEVRYSWGVTPTDYTYTGQYSNMDDIGLMYYGARWYDPQLARWNQPDTVIPKSQGTQSWDRFGYVNNNPMNNIDPTGHDCSSVQNPTAKSACERAEAANTPVPQQTTESGQSSESNPGEAGSLQDKLLPTPTTTPETLPPTSGYPTIDGNPGQEQNPSNEDQLANLSKDRANVTKIVEGITIIVTVDLLIVAPIAAGFFLAPELSAAEAFIVDFDLFMPIAAGVIYANNYGINLIIEGVQGK